MLVRIKSSRNITGFIFTILNRISKQFRFGILVFSNIIQFENDLQEFGFFEYFIQGFFFLFVIINRTATVLYTAAAVSEGTGLPLRTKKY